MNSVQLHLAFTHVPVILSLTGLVMLITAFFIKSPLLTKISYILILIAGITALPVFFTGEGSEEAIEHVPGVSGAMIEKHEEVAKWAMVSVALSGLMALAALVISRWQIAPRFLRTIVLLFAIVSGALMAQTAHLGGQIRHTEITNGLARQNEGEGNSEGPIDQQKEEED